MAQSANCLCCKHEDMGPQYPAKKPSAATSICNPSDSAGRWVGYQRASWNSLAGLPIQVNELQDQWQIWSQYIRQRSEQLKTTMSTSSLHTHAHVHTSTGTCTKRRGDSFEAGYPVWILAEYEYLLTADVEYQDWKAKTGHDGTDHWSQQSDGKGRQIFMSSRPAWFIYWVLSQLKLHRETLSQKGSGEKEKKKKMED